MILLVAKLSQNRRLEHNLVTILSYIVGINFFLQKVPSACATEQTMIEYQSKNERLAKANNFMSNEINTSLNRCSSAEANLDKCSAQLIGLGQSASLYPMSMEELNSVYCTKFKSSVSCIKNSTDCYKPFEKQIIK